MFYRTPPVAASENIKRFIYLQWRGCSYENVFLIVFALRNTPRVNTPSNKTKALSENMNADIWKINWCIKSTIDIRSSLLLLIAIIVNMIPSRSYMKYFFGGLLVGQIMRESNVQLEWFSCRNNRMNFNKFILHLYLIDYNFLLSGHYVTLGDRNNIAPNKCPLGYVKNI